MSAAELADKAIADKDIQDAKLRAEVVSKFLVISSDGGRRPCLVGAKIDRLDVAARPEIPEVDPMAIPV